MWLLGKLQGTLSSRATMGHQCLTQEAVLPHRPCPPCREEENGASTLPLPRQAQAMRASPGAPEAQICHLVLPAVLTPVSAQGLKQLLSPSPAPDSALGTVPVSWRGGDCS